MLALSSQIVKLCAFPRAFRSNDAVRANELARHLHVAAGLVDEGQVEGDLPP